MVNILFFLGIKNASGHFNSFAVDAADGIKTSGGWLPCCTPIALRERFKIFNVHDGVLALCKWNQAVGLVRRLSNLVPWSTRSCHSATSSSVVTISRYLIISAALLVSLTIPSYAQNCITISGQVRDANGSLYSGGSGVFTLVPQNVQWTTGTTNPVPSPLAIAQLDSFGRFSICITSTANIDQQSSNPQWQISFNSAQYQNPTAKYSFTMTPLALTSNQDITATITPQAALLPISSYLQILSLNNIWSGMNTWLQQLTVPLPMGCTLPLVSVGLDVNLNSICSEPSNSTGNAATATAFQGTPSGCTLPQVTRDIAANGNSNCFEPTNSTGNAATASAAASVPTNCGAGNSATGVDQNFNATGCFTPAMKGIQAFNNCPMSADVVVSTTVVRTVAACAVTMPASGCPCRIQWNWSVTVNVSNNNHIAFWVTDGVNNFRGSPVFGQSSDTTGSSGSGMTSITYANNATVTMTLDTQGLGSPSYTVVAAPLVGGGANSGIDVSALTSN
jgi:hypothetical protein